MAADHPELDFDALNAAMDVCAGSRAPPSRKALPSLRRTPQIQTAAPLWEVAAIFGGVFVGMGLIAWVFYAFFFQGG